jgi:glycosyltransferase involved in cell wall biosynthesis
MVICTRNRASQLSACLAAVARLHTERPWELVVVDNGSTDGTAAVIAAFAAAASFPVRTVFEPIAGLGRARNTGWRAAQGELIGFTDDDCYIAPDYVDRLADLFATPEIGFGGGMITLHDPSDYPITIMLQTEHETVPPNSYIRAGFLQGANMAFRRAALEQIGGFDPQFGAGQKYCPEDVDAEVRASLGGWTGVYEPALCVAHHHGRKAAAAARQIKIYALGRGAYFAKLLLQAESRRKLAKHVYWEFRAKKQPGERLSEIKGALGYLLLRAQHRVLKV